MWCAPIVGNKQTYVNKHIHNRLCRCQMILKLTVWHMLHFFIFLRFFAVAWHLLIVPITFGRKECVFYHFFFFATIFFAQHTYFFFFFSHVLLLFFATQKISIKNAMFYSILLTLALSTQQRISMKIPFDFKTHWIINIFIRWWIVSQRVKVKQWW